MDDDESIDKNTLYHEPFNVNMYTSAASGCSLNDLQRQHITPDYTGIYFITWLLLFNPVNSRNESMKTFQTLCARNTPSQTFRN